MTAYAEPGESADRPSGKGALFTKQQALTTANPYLARLTEPSKADDAYWDEVLAQKAKARQERLAAGRGAAFDPIQIEEGESGPEGTNDTLAQAEVIDGLGSGENDNNAARISGELAPQDVDVYAAYLQPGDVVGVSVTGPAPGVRATIYAPDGAEVHGSQQDQSGLYPPNSPLPGGGDAVAAHVALVEGPHYLQVGESEGAYDIAFEVYRSTAETDAEPQTLFLDFDGEQVDTSIWDGPGVRDLSPFHDWLDEWSLAADQEEAVARQVIETVEENLKQDLIEQGIAGEIRLDIKNSYDHPDTFGDPNVSRVIIGGSTAESGVSSIGISEHTDPGNFGHEDSGLVMLDNLSYANIWAFSLNHYIRDESDAVPFVGRALGNVVSHEAGHFLGNYHTDPSNEQANLMDSGGNYAMTYGVGPDGIGGTADDIDVDLGEDVYNSFTGTQDTLNRTAFAVGRP